MKKYLTSALVLAVVFIAGIAAVPVSAATSKVKTDVTGRVTDKGVAVDGAKVTVICNSNAKSTKTDSTGTYLVTFKANSCPDGATINVTAKRVKKGGVKTATSSGVTKLLNVAVVNDISIPEFGIVGASVASLSGIGAYAMTRRRMFKK